MRNNSMQTLMNTQHMMAAAVAYEPPRMTTVPIRATGAMLIGSMMQYEQLDLRSNFQASSDYDDGFSSETMTTASGWGDDFFSASPAE